MALVEAQQAFLNLTEAVADAGYGLQSFKDVPTEKVFEVLHNAGYSEVVTDSGQIMWTKPWWNTSGATSTATAGETMGQNLVSNITTKVGAGEGLVNITASSVGFTTEVSGVAEGVSMIATTPKLAIVTAVASACGLAFGFDLGQWLVDKYFGDNDFDWSTDSIGGKILTFISGDKTYIDEDLANRIKDRLIDIGAFSDGSYVVDNVVLGGSYSFSGINTNNIPEKALKYLPNLLSRVGNKRNENDLTILTYSEEESKWKLELLYFRESYTRYPLKYDNRIFVYFNDGKYGYYRDEKYLKLFNEAIKNGYFSDTSTTYELRLDSVTGLRYGWYSEEVTVYNSGEVSYSNLSNTYANAGHLYVYGGVNKITAINIGYQSPAGISGVNKQPNVTYPAKNTPLTTTYPDWATNKGKVPTKDGEKTVLPLKIPKPNKGTDPQNEAQTGKYPETDPDPYIEDLISENKLPNNPENIPTKDDGDTPTPVIPPIGVEATGFVALYNPTQSQLSSFSQYLWSNDFIDNFKKLFANPMDAIIGLHMIYATPSRGSEAEIVCGYAHSGVMSNTVNSQYIEIDCGSIKVNRYFSNVLDYAPYTKLQVYLPFVGIVDLDTNEIMGGTLNIKYRIDVLTGSCLARLRITRGDYNAELYNFAGNCAVQLPISGGSYSGIIANAIGVAGSIGATIASGGALAPVLVGSAVSSAVNSHVNVSHSGSLGSNAGALGIMKPYLIITRPKPAEADNFNEFYGKPSNKTVRLSSCSGYTRIKEVHVDNIVATDNELSEIEQLLKEGVII